MVRSLALAAATLMFASVPALAGDCGSLPKFDARKACSEQRYREAGDALNEAYTLVYNSRTPQERKILQDEQVQWINARNRHCSNRDPLQPLAEIDCVAGQTRDRAEALRSQVGLCIPGTCVADLAAPALPVAGAGQIPPGKVRASYFNGDKLVGSELVDAMAVRSGSEFQGIPAAQFRAVWEKDVYSPRDGLVESLSVALSRAEAAVYLDGKPVARWRDSSREVPLTLSLGAHRLRVEYANHWHTIDFIASTVHYPKVKFADAQQLVRSVTPPDARVVYIGAYEAKNAGNDVIVRVPAGRAPTVLFLASYSAIRWRIQAAAPGTLRAVFFDAYDTGSSVSGLDSKTTVYQLPGLPYQYDSQDDVCHRLETLVGHPLFYHYGEYALASADIPVN